MKVALTITGNTQPIEDFLLDHAVAVENRGSSDPTFYFLSHSDAKKALELAAVANSRFKYQWWCIPGVRYKWASITAKAVRENYCLQNIFN